jgi:hypothetical protein
MRNWIMLRENLFFLDSLFPLLQFNSVVVGKENKSFFSQIQRATIPNWIKNTQKKFLFHLLPKSTIKRNFSRKYSPLSRSHTHTINIYLNKKE